MITTALNRLNNSTKWYTLTSHFCPSIKIEDGKLYLVRKITYTESGEDEYVKVVIGINDELLHCLESLDMSLAKHTTLLSADEDTKCYSHFIEEHLNVVGCAKKSTNGKIEKYDSIDVIINKAIDTSIIIYGTIIDKKNDKKIIEPLFEISGRYRSDVKLIQKLIDKDNLKNFLK